MFDKNLEDFVKSVGLSKVSEIVLNCPEGFDKYLKSTGTYIKRSKQLCYNSDEIDVDDLRRVIEEFIRELLPKDLIDDETKFLINPTGRFVIGGLLRSCFFSSRLFSYFFV